MEPYAASPGWNPAFEVTYRFYSTEEGGRKNPPRQHIRWDFLYEGDDPITEGISMVWPEFISESGAVLPEGEVPFVGRARMFIVNPERIEFHRARVRKGVRGFFTEGSHKVAECEVIAVLGLAAKSAA
jgi:hypothetical protein